MDIRDQSFRALFELSPDTIMILNEVGFIDCNPATLKIFGCSGKSDFIGKHPSQFFSALQSGDQDSKYLANQRISEAIQHGTNRLSGRTIA